MCDVMKAVLPLFCKSNHDWLWNSYKIKADKNSSRSKIGNKDEKYLKGLNLSGAKKNVPLPLPVARKTENEMETAEKLWWRDPP